jgi:hypothetical protein
MKYLTYQQKMEMWILLLYGTLDAAEKCEQATKYIHGCATIYSEAEDSDLERLLFSQWYRLLSTVRLGYNKPVYASPRL